LPSDFNDEGLLPPGDYRVTFDSLKSSLLADGPPEGSVWREDWDASWHRYLIDQTETLAGQLGQVGIDSLFLDGSFTEAKGHPNDIDGYFECDARRVATGVLERQLNRLDPKRCWTWDPEARRPYRGYMKRQLPMWHAYRVELYPHYQQFSGITDERGIPLTFPSAFRQRRSDGTPKGIVEISLSP